MDSEPIHSLKQSRSHVAENLRDQAASYRRLAAVARTSAGTKLLGELADNFDEQARKLDPPVQRP